MALAALGSTGIAHAGTSAPFDVGPLALIIVLVLLGGVFSVFSSVGGRKGRMAFLVLLAGLFVYRTYEDWSRARAYKATSLAYANACVASAGESGSFLRETPSQIFVRVDPRLAPSGSTRLRQTLVKQRDEAGVLFVRDWPDSIPAGSALLDIEVLSEPVDASWDRYLSGVRATLMTADRSPVATRIDYLGGFDEWCLGGSLNSALEQFVMHRAGRSVGIATAEQSAPAFAVVGRLSPVESGTFELPLDRRHGERGAFLAEQLARIPARAGCRLEKSSFDEIAVCGADSPPRNRTELRTLWSVVELPQSWLVVDDRRASPHALQAVHLVESDLDGRRLATWKVLHAPLLADEGAFAIGDVKVSGRTFTAELYFQRLLEPYTGAPTPAVARALYRKKVRLQATIENPWPVSRP